MHETFTMKNGKVVKFYSSLGYHGLYIEVDKKYFQTPESRKEFEKEIKSERDVVKITYIK